MGDSPNQFAALADDFRLWVAEGTDSGASAAQQGLIHLTALFAAALKLPVANPEGGITATVSDDEWKRIFQACGRLPVNHYGSIFDPLAMPPDSPGVGDVADDIADIYRDVVSGLRSFQNSESGAVWHWRFTFWEHWGRHAVGAVGALRAWLEADGTGW